MSLSLFNTAPYKGLICDKADGVHISARDADIDSTASIICTTAAAARLAASDTVQVLSAEAADITQKVTIVGVTSDGLRAWETIALDAADGTTAVDSAKTWTHIENMYLDSPATGAVTLQRKTGGTFVNSVAIGRLDADVVNHYSGSGLVPYITGWWASAGFADASRLLFELRWYPSATSAIVGSTGFRVLDTIHVFYDTTATSGHSVHTRVFPSPIKLPAGGCIAVWGTSTANDKTGSAGLQVFDVPVV